MRPVTNPWWRQHKDINSFDAWWIKMIMKPQASARKRNLGAKYDTFQQENTIYCLFSNMPFPSTSTDILYFCSFCGHVLARERLLYVHTCIPLLVKQVSYYHGFDSFVCEDETLKKNSTTHWSTLWANLTLDVSHLAWGAWMISHFPPGAGDHWGVVYRASALVALQSRLSCCNPDIF